MRKRAFQRHRQRPRTPRQQTALRTRADARGTAGQRSCRPPDGTQSARESDPSKRGWRSVRRTATVASTFICGRTRQGALSGRKAADEDRAPTRSSSFRGGDSAGHGTLARGPWMSLGVRLPRVATRVWVGRRRRHRRRLRRNPSGVVPPERPQNRG
jgi:hypothetical protein